MKHLLKGHVIVFTTMLLAACSQNNPALQVNADTFAQVVNNFESQDIGNAYAASCGVLYATKNSELKDDAVKEECSNYCEKLTVYLNQQLPLKGLTVSNCESPITWQHYFESSIAHGRGFYQVKP